MDADQAKLLRKPFEKKLIQQIPKGGRKLDYVSHASTTDRLLQVDPEWTWRPMSFDAETGVPGLDSDGNLWIWLDVAGVTTPGVGDGPSMKERIGDAIRNAAMRRGVALDLWAQVDLDQPTPNAPGGREQERPDQDHPELQPLKPSESAGATPRQPPAPPTRSDKIQSWQITQLRTLFAELRTKDPLNEALVKWDAMGDQEYVQWSEKKAEGAIKRVQEILADLELGLPLREEPSGIPG